MMCGGLGAVDEAPGEHVVDACNKVRDAIEEKLGKKLTEFKPVKSRSQVVAGVNYFVKIYIGDDSYVHARIYHTLDNQFHLHGLVVDKKHEEPIEYFDKMF